MSRKYVTVLFKMKIAYQSNSFYINFAKRHYSGITQSVKSFEDNQFTHSGELSHSEVLRLSNFIQQICNPDFTTTRTQKSSQYEKAEAQSAINYWNSMEFPANTKVVSKNLINEFSQHTKRMSTFTLAKLLSIMAEKNVRHEDLLVQVCKQLQKKPSIEIRPLTVIIDALSRLTYLDSKLITKLKQTFCSLFTEEYNNLTAFGLENFALTVNAFGRLHLNDQHFWLQITRWIKSRLSDLIQNSKDKMSTAQLAKCVQAFAIVNVDNIYTKEIVEEMNRRLDIKNYTPRGWLSTVHQFATLQTMTPRMAESVLCEEFSKALHVLHQTNKKLNEQTILYDNIRRLNISNAARLELSNYKGPTMDNKIINKKKNLELARQIKFGTIEELTLPMFHVLLRLIAPLKSHSTGPILDPRTGAVVESTCFVDPVKRKFVPINQKTNDCKEVLILYFLDTHLTRVFDKEETGEPRLLGTHQMVVRHLKAAGVHPVVFTESEICKFDDNETAKVNHMRKRILGLCDKWHTNKWMVNEVEIQGEKH